MFLSSGFIWPSFLAVCGFDPNMTQISQYSIKLIASLTVELLPVLRTLPVHFFYFHSSVFMPLEFQSNRTALSFFVPKNDIFAILPSSCPKHFSQPSPPSRWSSPRRWARWRHHHAPPRTRHRSQTRRSLSWSRTCGPKADVASRFQSQTKTQWFL